MILEFSQLQIRNGQEPEFDAAFNKAQAIFASLPGYCGHSLQLGVAHQNQYLLMVNWATLADHEIGFRQSAQYQHWRSLLHHFFDPFATVLHYTRLAGSDATEIA